MSPRLLYKFIRIPRSRFEKEIKALSLDEACRVRIIEDEDCHRCEGCGGLFHKIDLNEFGFCKECWTVEDDFVARCIKAYNRYLIDWYHHFDSQTETDV